MNEYSDLETAVPRISLGDTADFDLGGMLVSPARRQVCMNGRTRDLQPKVAQVLVALAEARSQVVSRDRLIQRCWDNRIVGDDVLNRCIVALRRLAKEFTPEPFVIETVARVGYCLIEKPAEPVALAGTQPARWGRVAFAGIVAAVALSLALFVALGRPGGGEGGRVSIAVMPFRNLSSGEGYFAEGVSEEILGQLASEPAFRVAGATSSRQLADKTDLAELGRRLDVEYVVEGSVRTQGDEVRVNAALVRTKDGRRLWSDRFDGKADDIFAIQQRIGGSIAAALKRKLVNVPVLTGPLVTNGEAYNLYLTARGLLRTRQRKVGVTAVGLLRDAINADPGYAPAWASLALATQLDGAAGGVETLVAALPEARRYAARALELAPDSGDAHRALGILDTYGSAEAQAHFRKAAEIEPDDAESMYWLGVSQGAEGKFDQELASYRRAHELDPLWGQAAGQLCDALAEMGDRRGAETLARDGFGSTPVIRDVMLARIASTVGDQSEAVRLWSSIANSHSARWSETAGRDLKDELYALRLAPVPPPLMPRSYDHRRKWRGLMDGAPPPEVWRQRNRDAIAANQYRVHNLVATKLMLNAGRLEELAAAYNGPVGLVTIRAGAPLRFDQLSEAAVVALALRRAGLTVESERLLREADATARTVSSRSKVPVWFEADAAAIFAAEGRADEALATLERAMSRGWTHTGVADLRDINDEPAFKSLHGMPRFERMRAKLLAHDARERAETLSLGLR